MKWLKYFLFIAFIGAVIVGGVFIFGKAGKSIGENAVEKSGVSNLVPRQTLSMIPTNRIEEGPRTSRVVIAIEPSNTVSISPQVHPVTATETGLNNGKSEKAKPMEDMTFFINNARSALKKRNVPIEERRPTTKVENGEVIVTFPPKQGERAGSFIVRINRETGEIIDTKIWR